MNEDAPISSPPIDLLAGAFYAGDFHGACTWMREHDPLYFDAPNQMHAVTLHEDVMAVSKDAATFCSGRGFRPDSPPTPMMISMDRPEHMTRRNLVNKGFTPRRVSSLEPRVREICTGHHRRPACQGGGRRLLRLRA